MHSPCEYVCAHRRRHRISACVYTVLCVCVGLYTCVHGDVRKAFKSMPNIGVTQCSSVFAKRRVCYSLHAAEATCPSTIMVVVRVCRSELRGVVQDASERRSSITKLDHSRFDYSSQPTSLYPRRWTPRRGMGGLRHTQFEYRSEPFPRAWVRELCNTGVRRQVDKSRSGRVCALLWSNYQMA